MNSGFTSQSDLGEIQRIRNDEWGKIQSSDDKPEEVQSLGYEKQETQEPQKTAKNTNNTEMESGGQAKKEKLKDFKQKQDILHCKSKVETQGKESFEFKNELKVKLGKMSKDNSAQDNVIRDSMIDRNSELSNGKMDSDNGTNNMEDDLIECCGRKRKRCEVECDDNINYKFQESGLTCIGILPGLGGYIDSSDDSDQSCSSGSEGNENAKYDLLGRSIVYESKCSAESR